MESVTRTQQLLDRLDAIGGSLERSGRALALIGLGSVGNERQRLDEYSDLDFFAVVQPGFKDSFIADLSWLERVHPIAFSFHNTRDGHKVLFADGIYAEFAVFVPEELEHIPATTGRVIWQSDEFDPATATFQPPAATEQPTIEWLVGEILTNLYVGLGRLRRGEGLSAARLIQVHAVDRLIELSPHIEHPSATVADPFTLERRYESRFPRIVAVLPLFTQGYDRSIESALAMLAFLEEHTPVNAAIKQRILELCEPSPSREAL